jgi:hypothetical protein
MTSNDQIKKEVLKEIGAVETSLDKSLIEKAIDLAIQLKGKADLEIIKKQEELRHKEVEYWKLKLEQARADERSHPHAVDFGINSPNVKFDKVLELVKKANKGDNLYWNEQLGIITNLDAIKREASHQTLSEIREWLKESSINTKPIYLRIGDALKLFDKKFQLAKPPSPYDSKHKDISGGGFSDNKKFPTGDKK